MNAKQSNFGLLQVGIVALTLITAVVHLTLSFPDPVFILNGLGYLSLLAALFLPLPFARDHRQLVRYAFMGFTALTIFLWVLIGLRTFEGYATKAVELVLLGLLYADSRVHNAAQVGKDKLVS
jgi:hypothetical protein